MAGGGRFPGRAFPPLLFGDPRKFRSSSAIETPRMTHAREQYFTEGLKVHADPLVPRGEAHFVDEYGCPVLTVKGLET